MSNDRRYDISFIRKNAEMCLINRGVSNEDAFVIVDSMIEADCCGVGTHGIRMIVPYLQKIDKGEFSLMQPEVVKSTPVITVIDAKNCMGAVSANKSISIAINKAIENGIHVVFSKNCNTFGPAFYYVEKIARKGLIGFTCCNSPAAMPAMNGREPILGTNPFAFACYSKSEGPIIIDMATSIVAKSRFSIAHANGEVLQEGWALDKDGNPTIDPVDAIKGMVLPMAAHKGYGLAIMIDILSGVLSGAGYLNKVGKFYSNTGDSMNVGQMFVAIDPKIVYGEGFENEMDNYIRTLRNTKSIYEKTITIPGDNKLRNRSNSKKCGIILSDDTANKLSSIFGMDLKGIYDE